MAIDTEELTEEDIIVEEDDKEELDEDEFLVEPAAAPEKAVDEITAAREELRQAREEARKDRGRDHEALIGLRNQMYELQKKVTDKPEPPPPPPKDEFKEPITAVKLQQRRLAEKFGSRNDFSADELKEMATEADDLDEKLQELRLNRALSQKGIKPPPSEKELRAQALAAQYPDVYGDEEALTYARGLYAKYRKKGLPNDRKLHDRVIAEVRADLGMDEAPEPTRSSRKRLASGAKGSAPIGKTKVKKIKMTELQKGMADALYRDSISDPKERYRKWAAGPGKRMLEKGLI